MKIKIIEQLEVDKSENKMWSIKQVLDRKNPELRHQDNTINNSSKYKQSSFLNIIIREELAKGYTLGQVQDRLPGTERVAHYD